MAIDVLQEKIRKAKNPTVLELTLDIRNLPGGFSQDAPGYGAFCRELLTRCKGVIPAVRMGFGMFSLLGEDGLSQLRQTLQKATQLGYYVFLDAPELLSPLAAENAARMLFSGDSLYPCDALVIGGYLGSDVIKPFLPYCRQQKKNLFVVTRTANKSAPELQDLLSGGRLVHEAAADRVNSYGTESSGRKGYTQLGILVPASSGDTARSLRKEYPNMFFLVDGYDYPNGNAKNCAFAFDNVGHGAAVCCGSAITCAWKETESDGTDYLTPTMAAVERVKKNISRYVSIL